MVRNDLATCEGHGPRWKYPSRLSLSRDLRDPPCVLSFSLTDPKHTVSPRGWLEALLTYFPHPGWCQAEADFWFQVGKGQQDSQ